MWHRYSALLLLAAAARAAAQAPPASGAPPRRLPVLVTPGSAQDELRRARWLAGDDEGGWSLIRAASLAGGADTTRRLRATAIAPLVTMVHNTALPLSQNDGSSWAGRGVSYRVIAGGAASWRALHVVLAPELAFTQNRHVAVVPSGDSARSQFASPWHTGTYSADIPTRFGNESLTMLTPGQSRVEVRGRRVAGGWSSEDQWWGPGVRNALVLSSNAPGVPHLYLRTARPLRTPLGFVEARWIAGVLTESIYFDEDRENDQRSLSGAAATLRLAAEPGLTLGLARVVYAPLDGRSGGFVPTALDVLTRWGQGADSSAARADRPDEQLLSLFAQWAFPGAGAEVYGEWARQRLPRSLRELFVAPQASQGFTAGLQVVRPALAGNLRAQVEFTNLEQVPGTRRGPTHSFYTSRWVPQGYTHRGQALGAAIGPGASSQWVAADYLARRWHVGANFGRVRAENDAYYEQPTGVERHAHDVSLMSGVRAGVTVRGLDVRADLIRTHRLNYLFRNSLNGYARDPTNDVYNRTLRVSVGLAP